MKKKKYTKQQIEEADFHNHWGESAEVEVLDVNKYFSAATSVDFRLAKKLLGDIKGKRILDLGCGLGEASVFFALEGAKVTSLDISPKMLEFTKKLGEKYGVGRKIKVIESVAENMPFMNEYFDFVFGGNVLHHVNIRKTSKELKRILKKGGKAIFVEPLGYNPIIQIYRVLAGDLRTRMEKPFMFGDIEDLGQGFRKKRHIEQQFFTTLIFVWFFVVERLNPSKVRYWKRIIDESERYEKGFKVLEKIDRIMLKLPLIKRLCWSTIIELVK